MARKLTVVRKCRAREPVMSKEAHALADAAVTTTEAVEAFAVVGLSGDVEETGDSSLRANRAEMMAPSLKLPTVAAEVVVRLLNSSKPRTPTRRTLAPAE